MKPKLPMLRWKRKLDHYDIVELSQNERNLFAMMQQSPDNPSFVVSRGFHLRGRLDVTLLNLIYESFLRAHRNARATFDNSSGQLEKRIYRRVDATVRQFRVRHAAEYVALTRDLHRDLLATESPPLITLNVIERGKNEYTLITQLNHLICDAWSGALLCTYISDCYKTMVKFDRLFRYSSLFWQPLTNQLRRLTLRRITKAKFAKRKRFSEMISQERQLVKDGVLATLAAEIQESEHNHPTAKLALNGSGHFATDRPHALEQVSTLRFPIRYAGLHVAKALRPCFRHSMGLVLLAAYALTLWRYSGGRNIALRLPHHNRGAKGSTLTFGYLAHELYLNPAIRPDENFGALLKRLRKQIRKLTDLHMHELSVSQWLADHNSLPNVDFNYLAQGFELDFPHIAVEPMAQVAAFSDRTWHGTTYRIDVALNFEKVSQRDKIVGELVTRDAVTPAGFREELVRLYQTTLNFALANPEVRFKDCQLPKTPGRLGGEAVPFEFAAAGKSRGQALQS